jgi:hypothetical protein
MTEFYDFILNKFKHYNSESHHYAVFFSGDKIISFGVNSIKKHKITQKSTHAELAALGKISKWKNRPKKLNLFVGRLSKTGCIGESRPCYNCMKFLTRSEINIKNVYYTNKNGGINKENFKNMICTTINKSSGFKHKKWRD